MMKLVLIHPKQAPPHPIDALPCPMIPYAPPHPMLIYAPPRPMLIYAPLHLKDAPPHLKDAPPYPMMVGLPAPIRRHGHHHHFPRNGSKK